jgi:hypothetical protein
MIDVELVIPLDQDPQSPYVNIEGVLKVLNKRNLSGPMSRNIIRYKTTPCRRKLEPCYKQQLTLV